MIVSGVLTRRRSQPRARVPRPTPPPSQTRRGDRTLRMLALAYQVERLIEDGVLRDYTHAARSLGISPARMTQIANLLLLAPQIQEALLAGRLNIHERRLRRALRSVGWDEQWAAIGEPSPGAR